MTMAAHFDGRVFVPECSVSLPIGRKVRVEVEPLEYDPDPPGTEGEAQPDDPESIARWIEEMRAIPALGITPEEEAEWQADRASRQAMYQSKMDRLIENLHGLEK